MRSLCKGVCNFAASIVTDLHFGFGDNQNKEGEEGCGSGWVGKRGSICTHMYLLISLNPLNDPFSCIDYILST